MKNYLVTYHLRSDLEGLTNSEKATVFPKKVRVGASDARRAQSAAIKVINETYSHQDWRGGKLGWSDIQLVEVKVVG